MAIGTITEPRYVSGVGRGLGNFSTPNKRFRVRDIQITSGANYQTGGSLISPTDVGLRNGIEHAYNVGAARATAAGATSIPIAVDYTPANGAIKLQAYVAATGAEQAAAADLSTFSVRMVFVGR